MFGNKIANISLLIAISIFLGVFFKIFQLPNLGSFGTSPFIGLFYFLGILSVILRKPWSDNKLKSGALLYLLSGIFFLAITTFGQESKLLLGVFIFLALITAIAAMFLYPPISRSEKPLTSSEKPLTSSGDQKSQDG